MRPIGVKVDKAINDFSQLLKHLLRLRPFTRKVVLNTHRGPKSVVLGDFRERYLEPNFRQLSLPISKDNPIIDLLEDFEKANSHPQMLEDHFKGDHHLSSTRGGSSGG
jgi:hypothetical protein